MPTTPLTIDQVLVLLAETPIRMAALTADPTPAQLRIPSHSGEWSANDVLAHLRSCADVWGSCIATMIAEENPTLRAIDPRTWTIRTEYPVLDFRSSLRAFAAQRVDLLAVLEPLPHEDWSRAATVTGAGKPLVRTVESYAQWLVRHERPHLKQIDRIAQTVRGGLTATSNLVKATAKASMPNP